MQDSHLEYLSSLVCSAVRALEQTESSVNAASENTSCELIASFRSSILMLQRWANALVLCKPQAHSSETSEAHSSECDDASLTNFLGRVLLYIKDIYTEETSYLSQLAPVGRLWPCEAPDLLPESLRRNAESRYCTLKIVDVWLLHYDTGEPLSMRMTEMFQLFPETEQHAEHLQGLSMSYIIFKAQLMLFDVLVETLYEIAPPKTIGKDFKLTRSILTKRLEKLGSALPDEVVRQIMKDMV